MNDVRARFGTALRVARVRRQLTQEQLAEQSGMSAKFVGEIERGEGNPSLDRIARLATVLQISPADLFDVPDRGRPPQPEYRISKRELTLAREAAASLESVLGAIASPPYRVKQQRKR